MILKNYKLFTKVIGTLIVIAIFCIGCTNNDTIKESATFGELGIVLEGIDVSDIVLDEAKKEVQKNFEMDSQNYPNYGHVNWRIEALGYNYT